jgi:hypothetical protein
VCLSSTIEMAHIIREATLLRRQVFIPEGRCRHWGDGAKRRGAESESERVPGYSDEVVRYAIAPPR